MSKRPLQPSWGSPSSDLQRRELVVRSACEIEFGILEEMPAINDLVATDGIARLQTRLYSLGVAGIGRYEPPSANEWRQRDKGLF